MKINDQILVDHICNVINFEIKLIKSSLNKKNVSWVLGSDDLSGKHLPILQILRSDSDYYKLSWSIDGRPFSIMMDLLFDNVRIDVGKFDLTSSSLETTAFRKTITDLLPPGNSITIPITWISQELSFVTL